LEHTAGLMEDNFKENGLKTTWKAWVFTPGPMADATWANTKTTKSMDMEFTNGLMEEYTLDSGGVVNSMDSVCINKLTTQQKPPQ